MSIEDMSITQLRTRVRRECDVPVGKIERMARWELVRELHEARRHPGAWT